MKKILGLFLVFGFIGCNNADNKTTDIQKTNVAVIETNKAATPTVSTEKPIEIKATELAKAYQENASTADEKYKGKALQVSGKVTKLTENFGKLSIETSVYIEGKDSMNLLCKIAGDQQIAAGKLKMGEQATLIGVVEGLTADSVALNNCKIAS